MFTKFGAVVQNGHLTAATVKIFEFHKAKMADGRRLVKAVKSPYLRNCLTDFDQIWQNDAYWPLTANQLLKFRIFENPS